MAKIRIPCLVGKSNKAGVTSWYWQPSKTLKDAGWEAVALGKDRAAAMRAAEARNAEVEQWKVGGNKPQQVAVRIQQGTISALVARYRREVIQGRKPGGAPRIKAKTAEAYETGLKRIELWAGKQPLAYVTPLRVKALRDAMLKPEDEGGIGHSPAYNTLKTLRQLFSFAESVELIPKGSNPATDFGLSPPPPRRQIWEAQDDAAFDAAAYDLGLPSMALARELALYTAQREADVIAFTEAEFQELDIYDPRTRELLAGPDGKVFGWKLVQSKTSDEYVSVELEIPFEPKLRARVEKAIRDNRARDRSAEPKRLLTHVLIDDRTGLPWKKRRFISAWTKILAHAAKKTGRKQMTDLVWHDLRRTRVVRLRRRRMPKEMIATITGHSLQSINMMLKVYGPVDPSMTADAIASTLEQPTPQPAEAAKEQSA